MQTRFSAALIAIFALTIFTGSSLLFLVQPMFAKLVLPRLGGSSSVWNTCVLFFQTTLLLGYVYAHLSTRWLGVRRQAAVHLGILLLPLAVLPLSAGTANPEAAGSPVWWLLATMSITVGLPFFVVSTTAPLLQRWFATLPVGRRSVLPLLGQQRRQHDRAARLSVPVRTIDCRVPADLPVDHRLCPPRDPHSRLRRHRAGSAGLAGVARGLQLYLSRTASGGIVALHMSNRYLDLEPMLGALARAEGLHAMANVDITLPADDLKTGRLGSHWLMIAREPDALSVFEGRPGWRAAVSDARVRPWTDDYSNILAVLRWKS